MLSYIASLKPEWVTGDPVEALGAGFLRLELSGIVLSVPPEAYSHFETRGTVERVMRWLLQLCVGLGLGEHRGQEGASCFPSVC